MSSIDFSSPEFEKLVHLDLKGAPPLLVYLEQVFPLLKQLGATGCLIEYEDMFPYQGDLQIIAQPDAYTKEEIKKIQKLAGESDLLMIPLVQTFGHLEFLLKHDKFYELREVERYPNSICPSHPKTEMIILQMVNQVIESHQDLKYMHIGADEVWYIGQCTRCKEKMETDGWGKENFFVDHISRLVKELHQRYPEITFIIWDDMMRDTDVNILKKSGLGTLVQPMIWHYHPQDDFRLKHPLWEKYAAVFPEIWVASAFKGATEMTQIVTPPRYHIANHKAWIQVLQAEAGNFKKVRGIAITGWQRFDHYTVLCELFPVGLPTLAICLKILIEGDLTDEGLQKISQHLAFNGLIELDPFPRPQPVAPPPGFPGGDIYSSCLLLANFITEFHILMHHPSIEGAFSNFHVMHNRVNTLHIDQFLPRARVLLINMEATYVQLEKCLAQVYYPSTVEEWLAVNISPFLDKLRKLVRDADQQIIFHSGPEDHTTL